MATEQRLIDANALRDDTFILDAWDAKIVRAWLDDQPTVDAVEVVHADWINITQLDETHFIGFCSHCGTEQVVKFPTALKAYHKHCRWCGAKMDGDVDGTA